MVAAVSAPTLLTEKCERMSVMSALPRPEDKAQAVRRMFDRIAGRYDRVNRLMTLNADQRWRRELVVRMAVGADDTVLDLACGTGDFGRMCQARGARLVGLDFSRGMLEIARKRSVPAVALVQGDALHLPIASGAVTVAVSGFALRNFVAIQPVLAELGRVLAPGGRLGLLEVDRPRNGLVRTGHGVYFNRIVPFAGGLVSGDREAYRYLPASAAYLPSQDELVEMLKGAGFRRIRKRSPMFGAIQSIDAVRI